MIILTIVAFIVIFSVLILVHEWGHFAAARKAGIQVEEFGIGLPPRAKALYKDKKGTVYSLNWIPFGGYVRLYGEDSYDPKVLKSKKSFASKSVAQRTGVIVAGVVMNFILAWVIITIGFTFGMKPFLVTQTDLSSAIKSGVVESEPALYVHEIVKGSPLDGSNLKKGDVIVQIDGQPPPQAEALASTITPNEMHTLTVVSGGKQSLIKTKSDSTGKLGFVISNRDLITKVHKVSYPFYLAPIKAFQESVRLSVLTVKMLGNVIVNIVVKFTVPEGVAGPVGIAQMTHQFVQQGFMASLQFMALLSISLAVINIMPFPALDGGRFLFIIFEVIMRRKPNAKMEAVVHTTGFALLMLLIVFITWNDIARLVG